MSKLLLVDDSEEFLNLITSLLEFHGIDVISVGDPIEALEKVKNEKFDLIVSDLMMEPINGIEMIKKIKDDYSESSSQYLLITAKNLTPDEEEFIENYELNLVKKPIMPNNFYKKVCELLNI